MPLENIVKEWLALAVNDLAAAQFLMQMHPRPLEIIGFHCQQSIEKLLKAYLVRHDIEPDKTHDLLALLKKCIAFDTGFSKLSGICASLTDYAVRTRYPFQVEISETKVEQDLVAAIDAFNFIKQKVMDLITNKEFPDAL